MLSGGIDLGGTKIEARLFDDAMATREVRRVPTPAQDFDAFIRALAGEVRWLEAQSADPALPVAVSLPGVIDPVTGIATASNVPISGRSTAAALAEALGRPLPLVNDCTAFAYSEATGGAATGARSVLGLVLGTGVGAGFVLDGAPAYRHAGLAVELGHLGIPARALDRHGLPLLRCGCGRIACFENYTAGTGLRSLARINGRPSEDPAVLAASDDPADRRVIDIWADLAGEMLYTAQLMLDPEVIVLGGGLSNMPGITALMDAALARLRLGSARAPVIRAAAFGDSAGARGAALMAKAGLA